VRESERDYQKRERKRERKREPTLEHRYVQRRRKQRCAPHNASRANASERAAREKQRLRRSGGRRKEGEGERVVGDGRASGVSRATRLRRYAATLYAHWSQHPSIHPALVDYRVPWRLVGVARVDEEPARRTAERVRDIPSWNSYFSHSLVFLKIARENSHLTFSRP